MNYVAKLLMNSLYGKMAQDDRHDAIKVFTQEEFNKFSRKTPFQARLATVLPLVSTATRALEHKGTGAPDNCAHSLTLHIYVPVHTYICTPVT